MSLMIERWKKWLNEQESPGEPEEVTVYASPDVPKHIVERLKKYFLTGYGRTYFARWISNNYRGGGWVTLSQAQNMYANGCKRSPCIEGDRPKDYGLQDHIMDVLDSINMSINRETNRFVPSGGDLHKWRWEGPGNKPFGTIELDGDPSKNPKKYERIITKLLLDAINFSAPYSSFCQKGPRLCPDRFTDIIKPVIDNLVGGREITAVDRSEIHPDEQELGRVTSVDARPQALLRNELVSLFVRNEDFARAVYIASSPRTRSSEELSENVKKVKKYLNLIRTLGNVKLSPWYAPQLRGALIQAKKDNKSDEEVIKVLGSMASTEIADEKGIA